MRILVIMLQGSRVVCLPGRLEIICSTGIKAAIVRGFEHAAEKKYPRIVVTVGEIGYTESIESSGFAPLAFSFGTGFEVDAGSDDAAGFPVSAIASVGETNIRPSKCTEILVPARVYARTAGSISITK
jgi:hypothetical protein